MKIRKMLVEPKHLTGEKERSWNVVSVIGTKFLVAKFPYKVTGEPNVDKELYEEAKAHAEFAAFCFNNAHAILAMDKCEL